MVTPRVTAFGVGAYRGVTGRAWVSFDESVTVLCGANNSGKTTLLNALHDVFGSMIDDASGHIGRRHPDRLQLGPLDRPITADDHAPPMSVGFGIDFETEDLFEALTTVFGATMPPATHRRGARQILGGDAFRDRDDQVRTRFWFWFTETSPGAGFELDTSTLSLDTAAEDAARAYLKSPGGSAASWNDIARDVIYKSQVPGAVVSVPSARGIQSTEHRGPGLESNDGTGMPGTLLSLIAPQAEDVRRAQVRRLQIEKFVGAVLDEDVTVLVPWDGQTVHLRIGVAQPLPVANLGAGIEQLLILATVFTAHENSLVVVEEPDLYLHPTLQRQLVQVMTTQTTNIYVLATHSSALLDTEQVAIQRIEQHPTQGVTCSPVLSADDQAALVHALGFRASDLLQANAVLWVEGPSDRIYLNHWLRLMAPDLIEGVHYAVIIYGGRLGQYLSAASDPADSAHSAHPETNQSTQVDDLIQMSRINRHSIVVADSDISIDRARGPDFRERLKEEFNTPRSGFCWITDGVMIENYCDVDLFSRAVIGTHRHSPTSWAGELDRNPFQGTVKHPHKVQIARTYANLNTQAPQQPQLVAQLTRVIEYLRSTSPRAHGAPASDTQ